MYAIVLTGGKQYRVTAGSIIEVEKLEGQAGDMIKLDQVLNLSGDKSMIGSPHVSGAVVEAQILEQGKADKVLIFKKLRRHNYRRKNGHRQRFTALHITGISLNGTSLVSAEPRKIREQKPHLAAAAAKNNGAQKAEKASAKPAAPAKKPAAKTDATKKAAAPKAAAEKKPAAQKAAK